MVGILWAVGDDVPYDSRDGINVGMLTSRQKMMGYGSCDFLRLQTSAGGHLVAASEDRDESFDGVAMGGGGGDCGRVVVFAPGEAGVGAGGDMAMGEHAGGAWVVGAGAWVWVVGGVALEFFVDDVWART